MNPVEVKSLGRGLKSSTAGDRNQVGVCLLFQFWDALLGIDKENLMGSFELKEGNRRILKRRLLVI